MEPSLDERKSGPVHTDSSAPNTGTQKVLLKAKSRSLSRAAVLWCSRELLPVLIGFAQEVFKRIGWNAEVEESRHSKSNAQDFERSGGWRRN
jgi:hypothetical protein